MEEIFCEIHLGPILVGVLIGTPIGVLLGRFVLYIFDNIPGRDRRK